VQHPDSAMPPTGRGCGDPPDLHTPRSSGRGDSLLCTDCIEHVLSSLLLLWPHSNRKLPPEVGSPVPLGLLRSNGEKKTRAKGGCCRRITGLAPGSHRYILAPGCAHSVQPTHGYPIGCRECIGVRRTNKLPSRWVQSAGLECVAASAGLGSTRLGTSCGGEHTKAFRQASNCSSNTCTASHRRWGIVCIAALRSCASGWTADPGDISPEAESSPLVRFSSKKDIRRGESLRASGSRVLIVDGE